VCFNKKKIFIFKYYLDDSMNEISEELRNLCLRIQENKKIFENSQNSSFDELKTICNNSSQMVAIFEFENLSYSMVYANKSAYEFLGTTEEEINRLGFKYILKLIHPENITAIYQLIKFYNDINNSNKSFSYMYYLKSNKGWEWAYASVKPAIINENGEVRYLIGVGCSIDDILRTKRQVKLFQNNFTFFEDSIHKFLSLTTREKEILKLISDELTSKEIANKLNISPLTVNTYRKNLIEKLNIKSSIRLVKYSLLFDLI
jgi:DNA-binding CsgD family transcriptional regulator/PAS domain-containing protein